MSLLLLVLYLIPSFHCIIYDVLNIRDFDTKVHSIRHSYNGIEYDSLYPLPVHRIVRILDNDQLIWSENRYNFPLTLIDIHYFNNEIKLLSVMRGIGPVRDNECFVLDREKNWLPLNAIDCYDILKEIRRSTILDIADYKQVACRSIIHLKSGNSIVNYKELLFRRINGVKYKDFMFWYDVLPRERVKKITVHYILNDIKLVHLDIKHEIYDRDISKLYFEIGNDCNWSAIEYDDYLKKSRLIERGNELDITSSLVADPSLYNIIHNNIYGLPSIIYYSKDNVIIIKVKYGDYIIWESNDPYVYTCPYTIVYYKDNVPVLVQVHIETDELHGDLYYHFIVDKWTELTCDEFYKKLDVYDEDDDHAKQNEKNDSLEQKMKSNEDSSDVK